MGRIGSAYPRIDAAGKVTGETLFPGDIDYPDQLHAKILFARRPHARIIRIDTGPAEAIPGVVAVLTARDVPVNEYGLNVPDQPVLCGPGASKPYTDRVRFVGDQIAMVVAETEAIAARARDAIVVDFEPLPVLADPLAAMEPDAFQLHPDRGSNVLHRYRIRKGDVESALARAAVVIEGEYRTPAQEHAYLQPEAGLGYIDAEGRITVEVAGQWTHEDQAQIAHALDLPKDRIRVIYPAIGGAFGGREDMSIQIVLALAALRLQERGILRPVKIIWTREESIIGHHKRHPYIIRTRWGADADGKIIAAQATVIADAGAYAYTSTKVLGNATLMCTGPYEIENAAVDACCVYTNNIPGGAFRGFGGPQGAFAAEQQMNKLAQALGLDPVEIRRRNVIREGSRLTVNTPVPKGVSMEDVLEACVDHSIRIEAPRRPWLKRGEGLAIGFKNIGFSFGFPEQCWATIELHGKSEIERVVLHHAGADVGQGAHTVMAQMAAEAAGVPVEKVELVLSDTATSGDSGSASASRLTFMSGNAIRGAAAAALARWADEERPAVADYRYVPPATSMYHPETGECDPNFAYGYVAERAVVEVDTETGQVHILDLVCADDVGRVINRQGVEGQIEGCVVQAAGYVILEDFIQKDGVPQNPYFSTYLIPGVLDIPDRVHSVILEYPDPVGPWGVRGMAEMPYIPLAPAVTAAVHAATGVWFDEFPLTPERVLRGLGKIA
ncbi:MAG TPA: xanthine dehydrogenase family protein molybdopterin-binding subunit [Anaerolineales bacterium]|nr:xanthine dehydrogenase family protein molybdopterin-binding subunit [Anaerolineales bacterium]